MGTTSDFLKLRSSGTPKVGEWNINYTAALNLAKKDGKALICCWSNGDICSLCKKTEVCMMDKVFTDWMKQSNAYFIFQYNGDPDGGKTVKDLIYKNTGLKTYPGFSFLKYDPKTGKVALNSRIEGNALRDNRVSTAGARKMVSNIQAILAKAAKSQTPTVTPTKETYKIRFNEKLTVKKVNSILDAIEKNGGYCPCQAGKTSDTKCHCKDFIEKKAIGKPCICNLFVKQKA